MGDTSNREGGNFPPSCPPRPVAPQPRAADRIEPAPVSRLAGTKVPLAFRWPTGITGDKLPDPPYAASSASPAGCPRRCRARPSRRCCAPRPARRLEGRASHHRRPDVGSGTFWQRPAGEVTHDGGDHVLLAVPHPPQHVRRVESAERRGGPVDPCRHEGAVPGQGGDVDGDTVHHHPGPIRRQRHDRPDVLAESAAAGILVRPPRDAAEGRRPEGRPEVDDAQAIALADQQPAARHSLELLPVLDLPAVQRPDRESAPLPPPLSIRIPAGTHPARLDQAGSSKRVTSRRVAKSTRWTVVGWLSLRAACSHATYRIEGSVAAPPIKACPIGTRRPASADRDTRRRTGRCSRRLGSTSSTSRRGHVECATSRTARWFRRAPGPGARARRAGGGPAAPGDAEPLPLRLGVPSLDPDQRPVP